MTEQEELLTACVNYAIQNFNRNEQYLISRDLSERCICAKFASYLEKATIPYGFSEYFVDVEYNRGSQGNEYAAKLIDKRHIVVDLIVHKRGYDANIGFQNLICIEMKKNYKRPDMSADLSRLEKMTTSRYGFGYKAGFMIVAVANRELEEYKLHIDYSFYESENVD